MARAIFVLTILRTAAALDECSGYTYSPYTCNQDDTHRVCARLVDSTSTCDATSPSFWTVTEQESWATEVCDSPNSGTDWCICMWAYADYIAEEGCDASLEILEKAVNLRDVDARPNLGESEL